MTEKKQTAKRYGRVRAADGHHYTPRPPRKKQVTLKDTKGKKRRRTLYTNKDESTGMLKVGPTDIQILAGKMDFSTWSDEDLIRGAKKGRRNPTVIPAEVHQELARRIVSRAQHTFLAELQYAMKEHFKLIKDRSGLVSPQVKLRAIEVLYDRVLGKPFERLNVDVSGDTEAWKQLVASAIVPTMEELAKMGDGEGDIVDGEIVEGSEEDEDE